MVDVGHDPNTGYDASHSVTNRKRDPIRNFGDLGPLKADLQKRDENAEIDLKISPKDPKNPTYVLRAGISKRGMFIYYREIDDSVGKRWIEYRQCSLGEQAAIKRFDKTGKVSCRYSNGIQLFYRE